MRKLLATLLGGVVVFGAAHLVSAAPIAQEQFIYNLGADQATGTLNGGTGWSGAWSAHSGSGAMDIIAQQVYGALATAGGMRADTTDVRNGRSLDATAAAAVDMQIANNEVVLISFIAQDGGSFAGASGVTLFNGGANGVGGAEQLFFGSRNGLGAGASGDFYVTSTGVGVADDIIGTGVDATTLSYVQIKLDYSGANTAVTVGIFTGGDLLIPTTSETFSFVGDLDFDTIRLTRDLTVDEILIEAVPEPASLSLLALGGLILLRRRV